MLFRSKLEGHPDNVAPALFGGLTISLMVNERPQTIKATFPAIGLLAYIPDFELETKVSRSVLPKQLEYATAVRAGSVGNALVAALLTDDLEMVAELIEQDGYHEPYREKLVPHLKVLRELGHKVGAKGTYLERHKHCRGADAGVEHLDEALLRGHVVVAEDCLHLLLYILSGHFAAEGILVGDSADLGGCEMARAGRVDKLTAEVSHHLVAIEHAHASGGGDVGHMGRTDLR